MNTNTYSEVIFYSASFGKDNKKPSNEFFIDMKDVHATQERGKIISIQDISLNVYLKPNYAFKYLTGTVPYLSLGDKHIKVIAFSFAQNVCGNKIHQFHGHSDYQDMISLFYPKTPSIKCISSNHVAIPLMFGVEKNITEMCCYTTIPKDAIQCADFLFTANIRM